MNNRFSLDKSRLLIQNLYKISSSSNVKAHYKRKSIVIVLWQNNINNLKWLSVGNEPLYLHNSSFYDQTKQLSGPVENFITSTDEST